MKGQRTKFIKSRLIIIAEWRQRFKMLSLRRSREERRPPADATRSTGASANNPPADALFDGPCVGVIHRYGVRQCLLNIGSQSATIAPADYRNESFWSI